MSLIRTEQINVEWTEELSTLCHLSKNLWNEALYLTRSIYFHNKHHPEEPKQTIPGYNVLAGTMKTSENFKGLNAQSAQQLLKVLDKSWKSYWNALKEYKKKIQGKFLVLQNHLNTNQRMEKQSLFSQINKPQLMMGF